MVRWTDHLDMTIAVDWNVKHQTKQIKTAHTSVKSFDHQFDYSGFYLSHTALLDGTM